MPCRRIKRAFCWVRKYSSPFAVVPEIVVADKAASVKKVPTAEAVVVIVDYKFCNIPFSPTSFSFSCTFLILAEQSNSIMFSSRCRCFSKMLLSRRPPPWKLLGLRGMSVDCAPASESCQRGLLIRSYVCMYVCIFFHHVHPSTI